MVKSSLKLTLAACVGTILVLSSLHVSVAQVMQSTNFQIQSDSVNLGGGLSTSTNYTVESTMGEAGSGISTSSNYTLKGGYQQMQEVYIAISSASDVSMSPAILGVTGGVADGSTTVTVTTDSPAGYYLGIKASNNPAMQKGADVIDDYSPAAAPPDFTFTTASTDSHFGYSPEGINTVQRFNDNGAACNVGSLDTASSCWDGLSTADETVAMDTNANHPLGATTTIRFRVGVGSSVVQPEGTYTATTTLTALPL